MPGIECRVRLTHADFVMQNHHLHDISVMPGVAYFDLVYRALIAAGWDHTRLCIRDTVLAEAIVTTDGHDQEILLTVGEREGADRPYTVRSRWLRDGEPCSPWRENAHGLISETDEPEPAPIDLDALRAAATGRDDLGSLYERARREQIRHGRAMRCAGPMHLGAGYLVAELRREHSDPEHDARFHLHPASLDASTLAGFGQVPMPTDDPFVPMFVREFRAPRPLPATCFVHVPEPERLAPSGDVITTDYTVHDEHGRFLAGFSGLTCKRIREPGLIRRLLADLAPPAAAVSDVAGNGVPAAVAGVAKGGAQAADGVEGNGVPAANGASADRAALAAYLRAEVASRLGRAPADVSTTAGFYDLGLDSLALLRLTGWLEELVGEQLYPTLLFEHSTVDDLAAHLAANHRVRLPADETGPTAVPDAAGDVGTLCFVDQWEPSEPSSGAAVDDPLVIADAVPDGLVAAAHLTPAVFGDWRRDVVRSVLDGLPTVPRTVVLNVAAPGAALLAVATALAGGGPRTLLVLASGADVAPEQAAVGAMARTMSAEVPDLRCRFVHVDDPAAAADAVRAELAESGPDAEVRYRGGRRLVRRWREVTPDQAPQPGVGAELLSGNALASSGVAPGSLSGGGTSELLSGNGFASSVGAGVSFREGGVYLVSGGSGRLAGHVARHLAQTCRARIALVSRTFPDADRVREWEAAGAQVHAVRADVTDADEVRRAVAEIRGRFGRIDGVVHCAGVTGDGLFFRKDVTDLDAVLRPKVDGAVHLDAATADDDLDLFVVFGSSSAAVANPGQSLYAYANACLEQVARRGRGRTLVIGWPFWADGGMTVTPDVVRRSRETSGLVPMPTADGIAVLRAALAGPHDRLVVLHGERDRIRALLPSAEAPAVTPAVGAGSVAASRFAPTSDELPIAIIGLAGRYPGAADLREFWRNLADGRDCVTEVPTDRWDHDAVFDPAKGVPGRTYGRWGGFLDGVDLFAPAFFGISRRDAERMDPQERLFLTTCWQALHDAGYPPDTLGGDTVAVYAGLMWNHYQLVQGAEDGVAPTSMHCAVANRVSHAFDLTGPSMAIDTACSSSLTAIHLAVQSIRRGECTLALAGGTNVTVHPQKYLQLAQGQWLSEDGRCRAFGRGGTGYVPGEGVGAVLLKPLAAAVADGDHIHGVIRSTALNHTGRTSGVTVPSPTSQAALIRAALDTAGWDPATIGYIEAHGTGTSLGDPIEVEGLRKAFADAALPAGSCAIGSVKSSVGHLEGAAGVAGVTKVLLQLRHGQLAPTLHAAELNPHIDFDATPFRVQRSLEPWPSPDGGPRRAGVSAFGAGGANAHVLIEEWRPEPSPVGWSGPSLVVLSATTADDLRAHAAALADALSDALGEEPASAGVVAEVADLLGVPVSAVDPSSTLGDLGLDPSDLASVVGPEALAGLSGDTRLDTVTVDPAGGGVDDLAYTTQVGRTPMPVRLAVVAGDRAALRAALGRFVLGEEPGADAVWAPGSSTASGGPTVSPEDCVALFRAGRLRELAEHWVNGAAVPWRDCYPRGGQDRRPRRVSLPVPPLPEERCWLGGWSARNSAAPVPASASAVDPVTAASVAAPRLSPPPAGPSVTPPTAAVFPRRTPPDPGPAVAEPLVDVPAGEELEFRVLDHGVALVAMRSPMFTAGLLGGLQRAFAEIERREDVRAVVVTGSGTVFSMGGTPEALRTLAVGDGTFTDAAFVYEGMLRCTRPVVTAVAGHASGGGLAFACYGDVVVMAEESVYSANFTKYGFTPGMGATYVLEQRFGAALSAELLLTGRSMTGDELRRRGANITVVPRDDVLPAALDLARSMADKPPAVVRLLKDELAGRMLRKLPEIIASEVRMHEQVLGDDSARLVREHFEKVDSFRASTPPAAVTPVGVEPTPPAPTPNAVPPAALSVTPAVVGPTPVPSDALPVSETAVVGLPDPAEIRTAIEETLGSVLYLRPDEIDPTRSFSDLGLDSIGAVEIVRDLNRRFGTDLDSVAVYDHPTVPELVDAVREAAGVSATLREQAAAPAVQAAPVSRLIGTPPASEPAPVVEPALTAEPVPVAEPEPVVSALRVSGPPPLTLTIPNLDNTSAAGTPANGSGPGGLVVLSPVPGSPGAAAAPTTARTEPDPAAAQIAVIGMAGRFPDAPDLDAFWRNLADGHSSIREVPRRRWDLDGHYDPDPDAPGRTYSKWAALLDDVDAFDAGLFRLSPLDAEAMDPQQRLFLEQAWAALEDAGYAGGPLRCGVFVGCAGGDYARLLDEAGQGETSEAFLGTSSSILPARIAYVLDLTGPTMAIDTACSSSLTAVHLASESIRAGECDVALAGGVAVMCTPRMHIWTSKTGMLSPTGRCAPFDASADGIVLGEGVGAVVLKRLDRALADGDHVHGVLLAGGVNGDGRTNGITAPSAVSQASLLSAVHARAGITGADLGYVEAHGTGTPLGDPIEVKALARVLGPDASCAIGSVKSNIGHTTMSAGIAGLIKVLLAMRHRQLPPSLNVDRTNPAVDLTTGPLSVVRELRPWRPGPSGRLVAGVSSFGFSGTNSHLVVAEAPPRPPRTTSGYAVVPVSARSAAILGQQLDRLAAYLDGGDGGDGGGGRDADVHDVAHTLGVGRAHLPVRTAFVVADLDSLVRRLRGGPADPGAPAELVRLAEDWIAGGEVDWSAVNDGRRTPLPTYPFARDRYWVGRPTPDAAPELVLSPADPLVADHVVDGTPVLPGAAFLLLATGTATPARIGGVNWLYPVTVTEPVSLSVARDGTGRVELTSRACGGQYAVAWDKEPGGDFAPLDLRAIEARCRTARPVDGLYEAFALAGVRYGPTFRVLTDLRIGADEAIGTLAARAGDDVQVLDGALQAIAGLMAEDASHPVVPFAVESVVVLRPLPADGRTHVTRRDSHRFDVTLTDADGVVCARCDGVALRPLGTPAGRGLLYAPAWHEAALTRSPHHTGRVAVLHTAADASLAMALHEGAAVLPLDGNLPDGPPFDAVYVLARTTDPTAPAELDRSTTDGFRLVRRLIDSGYGRRRLVLTFVVAGAVPVDDDEPVHPHAAGLVGLAAAVAAEYPEWSVTCVDVGAAATVDADPARLAAAVRRERGEHLLVALRGGRRLVRALEPIRDPAGPPPLRADGVYLIVGGTGGIGIELSRHLAGVYRARLAWVGRSPLDDRIRDRIAEIEALGGRAIYLRADAGDPDAMRRAVAATRERFGPVNGAFHAAIVLRDRSLANLDEADVAAVHRPKVAGLAAMADAVRDEPLDFLALFSSALSFAPAAGQANYAAASTFEDSYGLALGRAGVPVRVLNWGFWGSVGAVADERYAARFDAIGITSIEPPDGLAALERVLAGRHQQVAVLKGSPAGLARLGVRPATSAAGSASDPELARASSAFLALDRLARDLLRGVTLPAAVHPDQARLRDAVAAATATADLEPADDPLTRFPDLAPHVELLRRCVAGLPTVLDGTRPATEVLFPGGSAELVESVYRGQAVSDFYHRLMATEAAAAISRVSGRRPRMVEIGAGTGAGTTFVLPVCADARYEYTDVSTAFLRHGENAFAERHPQVSFRLLDIERDPVEQGFDAEAYDVVLATNVLHATGDIDRTLRNARRLLRPDGVLLVNEVTRTSDFLTATFGLLPGWWRATDARRRLPHSPLLAPAQWRAALADAGFAATRVVGVPGTAADDQEQCVLVASAAAVRPTSSAARAYVRRVFAEVLKFREADLDDRVTFENFGVDSLVSQRIVRRFEADLGDLPATLLFEHLTIEQLAAHLAADRPAALTATLGTTPAHAPSAHLAPSATSASLVHPAPATSAASPAPPDVTPDPRDTRAYRGPDGSWNRDEPAYREEATGEGIAVVGVTGRYPGAPDLDRFWHNLVTGTASITEVPPDRWDWREHFDPRRGRPQRSYSRWAGFIDGVDRFDPAFFGILPRDAAAIDPQERLFLETAWLLLEDAGYLGAAREPETGVFVGTMYGSYGRIAAAQGWPSGRFTDGHSAYWSIANRVSYVLDLTGPSLAVDSACSSSLTAVHLACESLRRGECRMAIAGGVNLILHPAHLVALSSMTMLADDDACKVFDERADGFVPGEGVGAVLLKPLSDAVRDGDRIWGVIRGGFANAGGKTAGYTVPNPTAQADLVVRALRGAGVEPGDIGYVEAHGTGTALGDPIEVAGLARALATDGDGADGRCAIGSVKANIGHLEGAAGIAGLTKVLLQLVNRTIAPCANLGTVNPRIDLPSSFTLPREALDWPSPRRAGVSSFGAGGANVHLVVEEYADARSSVPDDGSEQLVLLSARTAAQLRVLAGALADLVTTDGPSLAGLAFSTQVGRAELTHRLAVLTADPDRLVEQLRAFADGGAADGVTTGDASADGASRAILAGEEGAELVDGLLRRRRWDRLAGLWVLGVPVDWARLWSTRPRRVTLPPYPFARQRFWLPDLPAADVAARPLASVSPETAAAERPLGAVSPDSVLDRVIERRLDGAEPWLTDHRVGGRPVLPAAASLELAYAACADDLGPAFTMTGVRWQAPLYLDEHSTTTVRMRGPEFEVGAAATGRITPADPGEHRLDLDAVRGRCHRPVDVDGLYAGLRSGGLDHGPGLRVLREVYVGDGECLALVEAGGGTRVLHPAVVDAALQALAALPGPAGGQVPVSLASLTSAGPLPGGVWVHAREDAASPTGRRFTIRVADADGRVLLGLDGLEVAMVGRPDECEYLRPAWRVAEPVTSSWTPSTVLVMADDDAVHAAVAAGLPGVRTVRVVPGPAFERVGTDRYALRPGSRDDHERLADDLARTGLPDAIVVVPASTGDAFHDTLWSATAVLSRSGAATVRVVVGCADDRPAHTAVAAALRTLAMEHSGFSGVVVRSAPVAILVDELRAAPPPDRVAEVRHSGGTRWVKHLERFHPPAAPSRPRPGGVYLITGGAGAIGLHLARHLAGRDPAAVVLAGRSEPDAALRADIEAAGATYVRADVTSRDDVRRLVSDLRARLGRIDGVIHAAGVHHDGRAVTKTPAEVDAVLAPKVHGTDHLADALGDEPLEFFALFSSVAAETGNLGQVDYAYANAYLDEFAAHRGGRTLALCWPLWEDGGMRVDDATRRLFARRWGSDPLGTAAALRAFDRAVAGSEPCVLVVRPSRPAPAAEPPTRAVATGIDLDAELRRLAAGFLLVDEREVDAESAFLDLGFDSISLTELINQVNELLDLDLLPTVLYECPSLAAFAGYLREHHADAARPPTAAVDPARPAVDAGPVVDAGPAVGAPPAAAVATVPPEVDRNDGHTVSERRTHAVETADTREEGDAVAVIGMAGVLPGSPDLDAFWRHLVDGDDLVRAAPADRTDLLGHPATATITAGFIDGVRQFDAALFGISPREATLMDPQQRLFLQTVWRTVEAAGYRPADLAGTSTGLFVGVSACDYDDLLRDHGVPVEAHTASGLADCILANRVSYVLDLRGPSEAVDTACSSSLVAVHRAARAVAAGECDAAIAGGVNVLLSPGLFVAFGSSGMLSPDGRCKTFDERADGYGRGEGCGAVLLKPLRRALADGDQVLAVIRGSAVNHAGRGPSLTAPNPEAQSRVIVRAYRAGGVDPSAVSYIEAHGTGTRLGDPIEIEGLKKAFDELHRDAEPHRDAGRPAHAGIAVGAVKTNIGHLEAAAGIAGLLKVLLGMRHGELPPTIHQGTPNPYLRLAGTPFSILTERRPWTGRRVAGISSFGFGGSNAHLVLESYAQPIAPESPGPWRLVLSASSAPALAEYRRRVSRFLVEHPDVDLDRVACTLQLGREHREQRFAAVVASRAEAVSVLLGETSPRLDGPTTDWLGGAAVDWAAHWPSPRPVRAAVPGPPFATTEFWFDERPHRPTHTELPSPRTGPPPTVPGRKITLGDPAAVRGPGGARPDLRVVVLPGDAVAPAERHLPEPVSVSTNGSIDGSATFGRGNSTVVAVTSANGAAEPEVTGDEVADLVRARLAEVLGTGSTAIAADHAFSDLGLDSIFRMELARMLAATFDLELTAAELYEHDTIDALSTFVARSRTARRTPAAPAPQQPLPSMPSVPEPPVIVPVSLPEPRPEPPVIVPLPLPEPPVPLTQPVPPMAMPAPQPRPVPAPTPRPQPAPTPATRPEPVPVPAPQPLAPEPSAVDGDAVPRLVGEVLERAVDPGLSFADNGLTSFDMLRVIGALEQTYGALPKTLLFDRPTMADLVGYLADRDVTPAPRQASAPRRAPMVRDLETPTEVDGEPVVVRKRTLPDRPALRELMADLDRRYAKEGGLAGRDIAPLAFVGTARQGYVNFSVRDGDLFAWSFVGDPGHFADLVADWVKWARRNGLRPNFLSIMHLTEVDGEPFTATPFGAVQRLDDLAGFTIAGGRMQRLRYMLGRFERAGACRTEEYRCGDDPATDRRIAELMDDWSDQKQMVNPYVGVVREEIRQGRLDPRHRMFLTHVDDELVSAIIVTRIPSENGYLLDLEFYPESMPLGGLEFAIVRIIERTMAEGCTSFSFGASFGVAICESPNADPAVAGAIEELHSAGIFGPGNFQFKSKFRPTDVPIYLCQPATGDRTSVTDIILMIANPDLIDSEADAEVPGPAPAPPVVTAPRAATRDTAGDATTDPGTEAGRGALLAAHGHNPLTMDHELVPVDLLTDSWAERADGFVARRMRDLADRAERHHPPELHAHDWLPFADVLPTRSGRSAEAMLCRSWPGRRGTVLHTNVFPTWLLSLVDLGFEPVAVGDGRTVDPDRVAAALDERTAFVVVEASNNAGGGYPLRLAELREIRRITAERGVQLVLDASRIVENAAFLTAGAEADTAGDGTGEGTPWPMVGEILSMADTATFSLSKDFGVSSGGLVATNDPALAARLREDVARRGWEVDLAARRLIATAVADADGVAAQVRRRMAAVDALWRGLRAGGVPVVEPVAGHCVVIDVSRMPAFAAQEHSVMSCLAWLYRGAGVRGGPQLSTGELAGCVRLAVPVGFGPEDVAPVVERIVALAARPGPVTELITGGARTPAEAARAVYQPVEVVPDDVREALREDQRARDDNERVLVEHRPDVRRTVVPAMGADVEVFTAGTGPTLLLMHPFNIGAGVFAHQFAELADRFQVVSVHHPGVGSTTAAADITLDGLAALERAVLNELGVVGPVHVAGASFGGLLALAYALRHPDSTATLCLLGSSYKIGNRVGEINRLAVVAAEDLDRTIEGSGSARLKRDRAAAEELLLRCESMDPQIGLRYLDVFGARPDLLARLPEVAVPTLVLQGRHDTVIPLKTAHLLHGAIPGARYVEIGDAGHFPYLTSPTRCNRVLAAFLTEHAPQEVS